MAKPSNPQAKLGNPESVTLMRPHGYIEDDGVTAHYWHQGQVVTDQTDIAILIERKADLVAE